LCLLERLQALGASLEARTDIGMTPSHYAALGNRPEAIRKLVKLGADINSKDQHGFTPLLVACAFGSLAVVRVLVEDFGVSTGVSDDRGFTAFHIACEKGQLHVVNFLFAHVPLFTSKAHDLVMGRRGAESAPRRRRLTLGSHVHDIIFSTTYEGLTAMQLASENSHYHIVERLNMALLLQKLPWMEEPALSKCQLLIHVGIFLFSPLTCSPRLCVFLMLSTAVLQCETWGIKTDGGTLEYVRDKFMRFIRDSLGMKKLNIPLM
jgi:ankyrin repeat protein